VRVDVPVTLGRALVTRKSLVGRSLLISRALGGALRLRLTLSRTAVERESRCLPLPRVASGRLGLFESAATPITVPVRALLAVP
jgi:hypothetical protein